MADVGGGQSGRGARGGGRGGDGRVEEREGVAGGAGSGEGGRLVTEAMVDQLARLAELEIPPERRAAVAEQLDSLLTEANLVNRALAGRREIGPAVRFHHPRDEDLGEAGS